MKKPKGGTSVTKEPPGESPEQIKRRLIDNAHTFERDGDQHRQTLRLLAATAPSGRS